MYFASSNEQKLTIQTNIISISTNLELKMRFFYNQVNLSVNGEPWTTKSNQVEVRISTSEGVNFININVRKIRTNVVFLRTCI